MPVRHRRGRESAQQHVAHQAAAERRQKGEHGDADRIEPGIDRGQRAFDSEDEGCRQIGGADDPAGGVQGGHVRYGNCRSLRHRAISIRAGGDSA